MFVLNQMFGPIKKQEAKELEGEWGWFSNTVEGMRRYVESGKSQVMDIVNSEEMPYQPRGSRLSYRFFYPDKSRKYRPYTLSELEPLINVPIYNIETGLLSKIEKIEVDREIKLHISCAKDKSLFTPKGLLKYFLFESKERCGVLVKRYVEEIAITWCIDDIIRESDDHGEELTEKEASEILVSLKENHDAMSGINWDVINFAIDDYIARKKEAYQDEET